MVALVDLWIPILVAAVLVFIASSLVHMVLGIHNKDYKQMPGEQAVLDTMRQQAVVPGHYVFPGACSKKEMGTPEMLEKWKRGPVGFMTVIPSGAPAMGKSLVQWFVFCIVVGLVVGYVATLALPRGTEGMLVFRFTASAALLGYACSHAVDSIWKGLSWSVSAKYMLDGLIYSLITGATFAWLWPAPVL